MAYQRILNMFSISVPQLVDCKINNNFLKQLTLYYMMFSIENIRN